MRLLIVDGCISQRGGDSRTKQLLSAYAEAFRRTHPEVQTETVTPQALLALRPFDPAMLDERDALAAVGAWDAPVLPWPGSSARRTPWWWQPPSGI